MQQELQVDFTWQSVDPVLVVVVVVLILVSLFFFLIARKTKAPKTKKQRKMMRIIAQSYGKKNQKDNFELYYHFIGEKKFHYGIFYKE